jgi:hypothetical protein
MKQIGMAAVLVVLAGTFSLPAAAGDRQATTTDVRTAQAQAVTEVPDERRVRRRRIRVPIFLPDAPEADGVYPRYYPGPDALRVCDAAYVPEYRPSGTVIVPHMICRWRR